jgi:predicted PurR-regulated permease PerM
MLHGTQEQLRDDEVSSSLSRQGTAREEPSSRATLVRWLILSAIALAWMVIVGVVLWGMSHMILAVLLLCFGALIAYTIFPLVKLVQRIMPRPLAILVVYLLILGMLCGLAYVFVILAVNQVNSLIQFFQSVFQSTEQGQESSLLGLLNKLGITKEELLKSIQQVIVQLQSVVSDIVPLLNSLFTVFINVLLVATLSIYFLLDGERVSRWLHKKTPLPYRRRISFLLDTMATAVGGYIRGIIAQNALLGGLIGAGVALLGVPYAFLLAMLAFFLAFIPVVGGYFIAGACILFALPEGWVTTALVTIFITLLQAVVMGAIVGPRIVGKAVGLHPIVAVFAIFAGAELFGLLGAFFAIPIAGVIQTLLLAFWSGWQTQHPEQFLQEDMTGDAPQQPDRVEEQQPG